MKARYTPNFKFGSRAIKPKVDSFTNSPSNIENFRHKLISGSSLRVNEDFLKNLQTMFQLKSQS